MKISIVGYGINPSNDLTMLGLATLKAADKALAIAPDNDAEALRDLGLSIENIFHLYGNGNADTANYEAILAKIVSEMHDGNEHLAVAIPGNPGVGVTIVQMLFLKQCDLGFELNLVAGISSFDWMLLENRRDPLERGTSILDANRLLLLDYEINPFLDQYIYHVCSVGTPKAWIREPQRDNHIALLKRKLLEAYPASHEVSLVSASGSSSFTPGETAQSVLATTTIENIEKLLEHVAFDSTLFIRAMQPKRINAEFLALLRAK